MRRARDDHHTDDPAGDDDYSLISDYALVRGGTDGTGYVDGAEYPDGAEYLDGSADTEAERIAADHRTKRIALIGLAAVLVIVALAITLTSLLVDTSPGTGSAASADARPTSPHAAAQKWGDALVADDRTRLRRLECGAGSPSGDVIRLIVTAARRIHAGSARETDSERWSVPIEIDGPDGSNEASADVTVVLQSGLYLVC